MEKNRSYDFIEFDPEIGQKCFGRKRWSKKYDTYYCDTSFNTRKICNYCL